MMRSIRAQPCYDVGDGFLLVRRNGWEMHINLQADVVTVDVPETSLWAEASWALFASMCTGNILRGGLPIHATGLLVEGKYIGIMAPSGTGKSTLAWSMMHHNACFGNDDLLPIHFGNSGEVTAFPSVSQYPKIHREVAEFYNLDSKVLLEAHSLDQEEFFVQIPPVRRVIEPRPLHALFFLSPDADCSIATVQLQTTDAALSLLMQNIHMDWFVRACKSQKKLQQLAERVIRRVPIYIIRYKRSFNTIPNIISVIQDCIEA